MGGKNEGKKIY